ncbi:hypothetical protein [Streptomyces flaveolus]|uniref:hypothetical protein n=1 Tax=Streptomyces flaveolus TaxID=67297 RepID=UPI0016718005|nr:hypothetical protein [Streptomyces flaveolus]GGQ83681.1 hypothetical protein GCM10010216_51920 [Streptomyces flaveolus]
MRRRPDRILRQLLAATLVILALMHPETTARLAETAAAMVLGIVDGIAQAAAAQPEAALLLAGAIYLAVQIRTHRPRARAHA